MKVTDSKDAGLVRPTPSAPTGPSPQKHADVQVHISQTLTTARARAVRDRDVHLQNVKAQLSNSTYRPDAQRIAEQILQQAELDAKLAALFK